MAELVDMKRTEADKKAEAERWKGDSTAQMEDYPYGLSIHLDDAAIEKLGLTDADIDAGKPVSLAAECVITSESINTVGGTRRRSMTLQLQKIGLTQEQERKSALTVLYGE